MQAGIATVFDIATVKFATRLFRKSFSPHHVLEMSLLSMFNNTYIARTLSNSTEAAMTAVALCFWPIGRVRRIDYGEFSLAILLVGLICLIRPSAVTIWIFPGLYLILSAPIVDKIVIGLVTILIGGLVVLLGGMLDAYFYNSTDLVFTWWNFFQVNLSSKVSLLFGSMPWHFYLSQGLPFMCFTMMPLIGWAIIYWGATWSAGFLVSALWFNSIVEHKEFRFIYPIMPVILAYAGYGRHLLGHTNCMSTRAKRLVLALIFVTNMIGTLYLMRWHISGPLNCMDWFRGEVDRVGQDKVSAFFLMPCHSTPYYSYLHRNVPMDFLSCTPPVNTATHTLQFKADSGFIDDADRFYMDPIGYIRQHDLLRGKSHVFLYEALLIKWPEIGDVLKETYGLHPVNRVFSSHWHPDSRRAGDIVIYSV